jgi:hypothetical protein
MPSLDSDVRWLRDREQIRELPQRYAYGIDTRDWTLVRSVFHDGCRVEGTALHDTIDPYLAALRPLVERYPATFHFMGNQYVEVDGDLGRVETYAVAYHMEDPGSGREDLVMAVRYVDTVRREASTWKIAGRRVIQQWRRGPLPGESA